MYAALVPKHVMPARSARSHSTPRSGCAGVAVVEDDRRLGEQAADEEVPHHPAGRREPEEPVAGPRVDVEVELLQVLEQDPALPVDDRPSAGRSCPRSRAPTAGGRTAAARTRAPSAGAASLPVAAVEVRQHEGPLRASAAPAASCRDRLAAVEVPAAVAVAVDGEQHLRLDLGEAVDDAARRRSRASSSTRWRRCDAQREESRDRLGDVRQIGGDAVAAPDACLAQTAPAIGAGTRAQLAPRPLAQRPQLGGMSNRDLVVGAAAEDVLRVAEPRAREPLRARHLARAEHALVRLARIDLEERPRSRPRSPRARRPTTARGRRSRGGQGRASR